MAAVKKLHVDPLVQTVEQRIAALAKRFDVIDGKIKAAAAAKARAVAAAPAAAAAASSSAVAVNPQWAPVAVDTPEVATLRKLTETLVLTTAQFKWVPSEYYERNLAWRRDILGAPSVNYLCKSIVMENTHCVNDDCSDRCNAKYYAVVFQYVERFDSEKLSKFVQKMNDGLGKKKFTFRLAANGEEVTGFTQNAVVPFGLKTPMPVILSAGVARLQPAYFWMGGGHTDCKLRMDTAEFVEKIDPFVADITSPIPAEELQTM
jgi:prolyl-tRNA editing enzyme YbaK/EbsC (Cys-tRNA(Pro) deacylase)